MDCSPLLSSRWSFCNTVQNPAQTDAWKFNLFNSDARSSLHQALQIHFWQHNGNTQQDFSWRKNRIIGHAFRERMCSCSTPERPRKGRQAMYLREWNVLLNDSWRSEMVRISLVDVRDTILYSAKDVWLLYVNCSIQFSACSNRETLILTNDRLVYYLFRALLQILLKLSLFAEENKKGWKHPTR